MTEFSLNIICSMKTIYHLRYEKLYKSLHNEGIKVFQEKSQKQNQIIFYVCESKIINVFTNCDSTNYKLL